MIFFKITFFVIGLIGLFIFWGVLGFVCIAMNQERYFFTNKYIGFFSKLIISGPLYLLFFIYGLKIKKFKKGNF